MINKLKPWSGGYWSLKSEDIMNVKKHIYNYLVANQGNKCAYCGNCFNITSKAEIEHIAAKGGNIRKIYPEFTFTPLNLVLACHLCNSPNKKGQIRVVETRNKNYKACTFEIVHPYFDNPEDHLEERSTSDELGVIYMHKSSKGEKTIQIFKLNEEAQIQARADNVILKGLPATYKKKIIEAYLSK
ncbi:hypothetical protein FNE77_13985 [Listeria monocytogenes]|nr:hypothetical protein [Listeria monocytogenes]EAW7100025.1 hypothetical protein [Listeria monocytogenes]EAW7108899.1 hypothetical protein [Listeria monocytogenes]ECC0305129.1 hypothetical protein [Listeria monocytogenes]ECC0317350.1 hypothetical protein [Listeria monocytogenes]